jgi:hypothetical protein
VQLFSKSGVSAVATLPLAVRRSLVRRYLAGRRFDGDEMMTWAALNTPFYRNHYGHPIPGRLLDAPYVTAQDIQAASPASLLSTAKRTKPAFCIENAAGAPGYFCIDDLWTMGANALCHPLSGDLAGALKRNPHCINSSSFSGSLIGPAVERLLRGLGGCVLNLTTPDPATIFRCLVRERPAVIVSTSDTFKDWLTILSETTKDRHNAVVQSLQFLLHTGPDVLLSHEVRELEQRYALRIIQLFTDDYSFAFFNCTCGAIHVPLTVFVETRATGTGQYHLVVTDLTRRTMPLVRYETGIPVSIQADSCPYLGQVTSVFPDFRY